MRRFGDYEILGVLGEGGVGRVYRARHAHLERDVALKVLGPRALSDPTARRRFARESAIACELRHDHLVKTLDAGTVDGVSFIAMELLDGDTLDRVLQRAGRLDWATAASLVMPVADALALLHGQGILHRDVKPSNIMVGPDGTVRLLDLGLARHVDATRFTGQDEVVGTLLYCAPELFEGGPCTNATDLWSLGCVLFDLIAGHGYRDPRRGTAEIIAAILNEDLVLPPKAAAGVPPELTTLLRRLVDRRHDRRESSALRVHAALSGLVERRPAPARPALPAGQVAPARAPDDSWDESGPATVPLSPQARRAATPAGAKPLRVSPRVVAGATLLAVCLTPLAVLTRTGVSPGGAQTPGARASSRASAEDQAPPAQPLTQQWRLIGRADLADLDTLGPPAWAAITRLRKVIEPPLFDAQELARWNRYCETGTWPGNVVCRPVRTVEALEYWRRLGLWLESQAPGAPPPRVRVSSQGPMPVVDRHQWWLILRPFKLTSSPGLVESAVHLVMMYPDDALGWLVLGLLLEQDGVMAQARRAYDAGLSRVAPDALVSQPRIAWKGLGRAQYLRDPARFTVVWWEWHEQAGRPETGYEGLVDVLELDRAAVPPADWELAARALGVAANRALTRVSARAWLADLRRRHPGGAR